MSRFKFLFLFVLVSLTASAQRLAVESFQLRPNDLSARKNQRTDLNGKPCALLKVMVLDDITKCGGGNIGDIVADGPVKLVYVTSAAPSVELSFKYHYPLTVTFADYGYGRLDGASTYELQLVDAMLRMESGNSVQLPDKNKVSKPQNTQAVSDIPQQSSNDLKSDNGNAEMTVEKARKIADAAFDSQNYEEALEYYTKAAELGDVFAQSRIGFMFYEGRGVACDYAMAIKWINKAAEQGFEQAQYNLGVAYYDGKGVVQDYSKAFEWFEKASKKGHVSAQYELSTMYQTGTGVAQDYAKSFKWCKKAAEGGNAKAQYKLAYYYEHGKGCKENLEQAFYWYDKSSTNGNGTAAFVLGCYFQDGKGITTVKDESAAFKYFKISADLGDRNGMASLASCYQNGRGTAPDLDKALHIRMKLAEDETDGYQAYFIGAYYAWEIDYFCWVVNRKNPDKSMFDYVEAMKWFRKSAEQNNPYAMKAIGELYMDGKGVSMDKNEAVKWFRKAAALGNGEAMWQLGRCYEKGNGVEKNMDTAVYWYKKGADEGNEVNCKEALKRLNAH